MDIDVSQRVRAARIQAGYKRREDLTAQLQLPRFGAKVLGQVERGERQLFPHEADELARVLGIDPGWFFGVQPSGVLQEILEKLDLIAMAIDRNFNLTGRVMEAVDGLAPSKVAEAMEQASADAARDAREARAANASKRPAKP